MPDADGDGSALRLRDRARDDNRAYPTASTKGGRQSTDPKVMADYLRQLPVGSRVRLSRLKGDEIRGTLMKNDGDPVVIQRRARVPEAPIAVPMQEILAVELDVAGGGNPARTIAIGAGVAAAATLAVLLTLFAIYGD